MSRLEKEGQCPNCEKEGTLNYGAIETEDTEVFFPVDCTSCQWEGEEYYELKFKGFKI